MAVNVVSFSFSWCSTGVPGVPSAGCWLSLLHLISNFSGPQTLSGFPRAPSAGCGFPYHISSYSPLQLYCNSDSSGAQKAPSAWCGITYHISSTSHSNSTGTWLLSWLSYIIVQRPLDRPLDLWNRHQAEITVKQFTVHSLPVHQSMSVTWEFFSSSHFICQFPPTRFPLITATRMCHFLPVHHLEWHFWPGRRSKYNNKSWNDRIVNCKMEEYVENIQYSWNQIYTNEKDNTNEF